MIGRLALLQSIDRSLRLRHAVVIAGPGGMGKSRLLAVRDSKDDSKDARVLYVDKKNGAVSPVEMDWSKTGMASACRSSPNWRA